MGASVSQLPPGFELDSEAPALPEGFEIDAPEAKAPETWESKAVRATQGMLDPALGIAQMVPRGIGYAAKGLGGAGIIPQETGNMIFDKAQELAAQQDQFTKAEQAGYDKMKADDGLTGWDGFRMLGNVVSPANIIPGRIASGLGPAATLGQRVAKGAGTGAIFGASSPTTGDNFGWDKLKQMGMGAAVGGGLPIAGEAIAKLINPAIEKGKQLLIDEGIRLTPGQIAGGAWQRAEEKATSIPFIGGAIEGAKKRGTEDLNRAVANRALDPIGKEVPKGVKPGYDMLNSVERQLKDSYQEIVPQLTGKVDQEFLDSMTQLKAMAQDLAPAQAQRFNQILDTQVTRKMSQNGSLTGESIKEIESELGRLSDGYRKSGELDARDLGDALLQAQANLRSWLARQNPAQAEKLKAVNSGWANYLRMEKASGMRGAKEGIFSPAQLGSAVESMGSRNAKHGRALMQDLSTAAEKTIAPYPDSGTAGRSIQALLMGGGKKVLASPLIPAGVAAQAIYSRPGQAILQALMTAPKAGKYSETLAEGVRKAFSPSDLLGLLLNRGGTTAALPPAP